MVQVNKPEDCKEATNSFSGNIDDGVLDPTQYSSREEYIEKAGETVAALCQAANFKYPSIIFAQMFWEGGISYPGGQCSVSNIAQHDHALFGIKYAGENMDDWYYLDGVGQEHSDGGRARAYKSYSRSVCDYIDWQCRNNGNGTASNGKSYSSYAAAANAGKDGQEGLSLLLSMGYCPNDYSGNAFSTASNLTMWDDKVKVSGEPQGTDKIGPFENAKVAGSSTSAVRSSNSAKKSDTSASGGNIVGDSTEEKIWNYCKTLGMTDESVAAVLGNASAESGMNPDVDEDDGFGTTSLGLWQLTGSERTEFLNWCDKNGKKWNTVESQVEWSFGNASDSYGVKNDWLTGLHDNGYYPGTGPIPSGIKCDKTYDEFTKETDIEVATYSFMACHERCANGETSHFDRRLAAAKEYYEKFKGTGATNATEAADDCGATTNGEDGSTKFGNAGIEEGEKYQQGQGSHYHGDDERTFPHSDAAESGCGSYSFTVAVNILIGQVHKYCGGEVYDFIGGSPVSTHIGWDDGASAKLKEWLKKEGLENTIDISREKVGSPEEMRKALSEQKMIVISNASYFEFNDNTGKVDHASDGHFIVFYKYKDGFFYANDSWGYESKNAGAKYPEEKIQELIGTGGGQLQVFRKDK